MRTVRVRSGAVLLVVAALLLSGCAAEASADESAGSSASGSATASPTATPSPTPSATPAPRQPTSPVA
ncbi:alpha/beta hydrolase, partial [Microbacterium lacticum]|nr:alpha/beta hydrolase [Microbacterium lacticum]